MFAWMEMTGNENPFYEYYDDVLDILRKYDVTISLGDALRRAVMRTVPMPDRSVSW